MRAFAILLLALGACATNASAGRLGKGEWQAVDVNGFPVDPARAPTLTLHDGKVSGSTGCNSYSGNYETGSRERIRFGALVQTEIGCEPPVMEQERRYLSILGAAQGYSFYGDGSVSIIAGDGRAVRFRRR